MTATIAPLTQRAAWKALEAHFPRSGSCTSESSSRTTPNAESA